MFGQIETLVRKIDYSSMKAEREFGKLVTYLDSDKLPVHFCRILTS